MMAKKLTDKDISMMVVAVGDFATRIKSFCLAVHEANDQANMLVRKLKLAEIGCITKADNPLQEEIYIQFVLAGMTINPPGIEVLEWKARKVQEVQACIGNSISEESAVSLLVDMLRPQLMLTDAIKMFKSQQPGKSTDMEWAMPKIKKKKNWKRNIIWDRVG